MVVIMASSLRVDVEISRIWVGFLSHLADRYPIEKGHPQREETYHKQMNINVLGPLVCCREAAKRMGTKNGGKGGNIVNISSGAAVLTGSLLYGMSKAALNAMSNNLVQPMAKLGIRVNTVTPGMTHTDTISGALQRGFDTSSIPMGRVGRPEEIADAVSYLMSSGASYVTGANIRVSGGRAPGTFLG